MRRILPQPGWDKGRYVVVAASATAEAEWKAFAVRNPTAAKKTYERLSENPLERTPRGQFPLRGKVFFPFWELEASGVDRIWYAVDQAGLTVIVAARDDVHTSPKLAEMLQKRRAAYDAAVAEVTRASYRDFMEPLWDHTEPLRVPVWAHVPVPRKKGGTEHA